MDGTELDLPPDVTAQIRDLARRHRRAAGGAMELINALGGRAEKWLDRLPRSVRGGLNGATRRAMEQAARVAHSSRATVPDQPGWVNSAVGAAMGAAGGFGGAPTALAELPVTVTLLMRVIQGAAAEHGFDPSEESVQFDCLTVFGSAGPLENDDGAETAFLSARIALNGAALHKIIATVAPRLAAAMGQKLAAQSVPILGAAAGAAINYSYVNYYREMAHVHFALRRLAIEANVPERTLVDALRRELSVRVVRNG
jgi:hypothetical protein